MTAHDSAKPNEAKHQIRVLVVDDAPLIRDALAAFLTAEGLLVVGTAADPAAALQSVAALSPDVVVLDVRMPPTFTDEGIETAVEIRRTHPHTGIVLLTQDASGDPLATLVSRLAHQPRRLALLRKEEASARGRLCTLITEVADVANLDRPEHARLFQERANGLGLTPRELDVVVLMAAGLSNRGIAKELFLSVRTVEGTVSRVFERLGLTDSGEEVVNRRVSAVVAYLAAESPRQSATDNADVWRPARGEV